MKPDVKIPASERPNIIARMQAGESQAALARDYGCSPALMRNILAEAGAASAGNPTRRGHPETPDAPRQVTERAADGQDVDDLPAAWVADHLAALRRDMAAGKMICLEPGIRMHPALAVAADRLRGKLETYGGTVIGLENLNEVLRWHGLR